MVYYIPNIREGSSVLPSAPETQKASLPDDSWHLFGHLLGPGFTSVVIYHTIICTGSQTTCLTQHYRRQRPHPLLGVRTALRTRTCTQSLLIKSCRTHEMAQQVKKKNTCYTSLKTRVQSPGPTVERTNSTKLS